MFPFREANLEPRPKSAGTQISNFGLGQSEKEAAQNDILITTAFRIDSKPHIEHRRNFAFDPDRAALLLVGGSKSGVSQKRFYKQLISKADELYDQHLQKIKAVRKAKEN